MPIILVCYPSRFSEEIATKGSMTREFAMQSAHKVAAYLKEKHGASRVLLFGSTLDGTFLEDHSDIDICFEGVAYDLELFTVGMTWMQFPSLDLDLIPFGHATAELRTEILRTGLNL